MKKLLLLTLLCFGIASSSVDARRGRRHYRRHRYEPYYGIGAFLGTMGAVAAANRSNDYNSAMRENSRLRGEMNSLRRDNDKLRDRISRLEKKRGLF